MVSCDDPFPRTGERRPTGSCARSAYGACAGRLSSLVGHGCRLGRLRYQRRDGDDIICMRPELALYGMIEVAQEHAQPFSASKLEGGNKVAVCGDGNNRLH